MNSNLNKPISLRAIVAELLSCYYRVHPEQASLIVNFRTERHIYLPAEKLACPFIR